MGAKLVTAMVVVGLCLGGCQPPQMGDEAVTVDVPSASSAAVAAASSSAPTTAWSCYVGPLVENESRDHSNPRDYCVGETHYLGASHRLGRINVFGLTSDPAIADGAYVQLKAEEHRDLLAALDEQGACPDDQPFPIQARSDWAPEEGSYFTTAERLRAASYLRATSAQPIDVMSVEAPAREGGHRHGPPAVPGEEVTIRIANPFEAPLQGLTLVIHYEGGRGKPMPLYETVSVERIAPGQELRLTQPAAVQRDGAWYRYASVSLEGQSAGCTFVPSTYRR